MAGEAGTDPLIPAVGSDGRLFAIGKMEAHRKGQLHLAVSAFVFDKSGDLLIQQRAQSKYHCPGLWANSCCTHPHWGEPVHMAVMRRLREELGFAIIVEERDTVEYKADVGNGLIENERVTLYRGVCDRSTLVIRPDPEEVAAVRWIGLDRLQEELRDNPEQFTPWFRIYAERYPDLAL